MDKRNFNNKYTYLSRNNKNQIESIHVVIRSVFLKHKEKSYDEQPESNPLRAATIPNELYVIDIISYRETAKALRS